MTGEGQSASPPSEKQEVPERSSWSQLNSYTDCGEKYRLSYIERVPRIPQGALIAGIAGHETIREAETQGWLEEKFPAPKDPAVARHPLVAYFRAELLRGVVEAGGNDAVRWGGRTSKEFPGGEDAVWWFERGIPHTMRRFAYVRGLDLIEGIRPWKGGVEMEVSMTMESGRTVVGRIDALLLVNVEGSPLIRDYKFGRPGGGQPIQLAVYARAVHQVFDVKVELGQFVYPKSAQDSTLIDTVDLRPLEPLVERKFNDFERGLEAGIFPIRESNFCKSCGVRPFCPYGVTLPTDDLPPPWGTRS